MNIFGFIFGFDFFLVSVGFIRKVNFVYITKAQTTLTITTVHIISIEYQRNYTS